MFGPRPAATAARTAMANADSVTLGRIAAGDLTAGISDTEGSIDVEGFCSMICGATDDIIAV